MSVEQKQPNHVERHSTAKLSALLLTCFTTLILVFWAQHQLSHGRLIDSTPIARGVYSVSVLDVLTRPSNLIVLSNSGYFTLVADALHLTFKELGIKHTVNTTVNYDDNSATYIVFTTNDPGFRMPKQYRSYNFEQLTTDKKWSPDFWNRLQSAQMVWDFSLRNIKILHAHNMTQTVHVPLGYARSMESRIPPKENRDVDVMFIGAMNGRRESMLRPLLELQHQQEKKRQGLQQANSTHQIQNSKNLEADVNSSAKALNIIAGSGFWGNDLMSLYSRSKIALNIHYYSGKTILEIHRILPIITNKVLVLSQPSDDPWLDQQYSGLINFTADKNMTNAVLAMLHLNLDAEVERRYAALLACCTYAKYVKSVLEVRFGL